MNREEAIAALARNAVVGERRTAARLLEADAEPGDARPLRLALAVEADEYVRASLSRAVARLEELDELPPEDLVADDEFALAIDRSAGTLVHELRPAVGAIVDALMVEVDNYEETATYRAVEALRRKLAAIGSLRTAARAPRLSEFDLTDLVVDIAAVDGGDVVSFGSPRDVPIVVTGDKDLVNLAVSNGIRNAREALVDLPEEVAEIVVTWGANPDTAWVVVLDNGPGLPLGADRLWDVGASSKSKATNDGLGLPICRRAARSMGGDATLQPRRPRGAAFEVTWPQEQTR